MADNSSTILKQLQQHQMQPPAGAFEKAWERCVQETAGETADRNALGKLKDFDLQPPTVNLQKIMAGQKSGIEKKKTLAIPAVWMRAAAVLLLLGAGVVLYITFYTKKDTGETFAASEEIKNNPAAKKNDSNAIAIINTDSASGSKNNTAILNTDNNKIEKKSVAVIKSKNKTGKVIYRGNENSFSYNDVFYTLVNYKEKGRDKWFYKTLSAKKITLNQYSYINLSDKMVAMLQELYLTKRNGKTARKAKKAKKKFDKWRRKDEKYFDKKTDKNPTDIIDLSDFLMYN